MSGMPEPVAVVYPDTGLRNDADALALFAAHGFDTGGDPLYSYETVSALIAERDALLTGLQEVIAYHANDNHRPQAFYIAAAAIDRAQEGKA